MRIKSRKEIEATNAFIDGVQTELKKKEEWRVADWSPASLKKLSVEELEGRWTDIENQLEAIDDQAKMMMWFICLRIREAFPSDKLMGEHINDLRIKNPTHPLVSCSQTSRSKWINAARWCEEMKITSLPEVGLTQKAVFILSAPINGDYSKAIYREIKGKYVSGSAIERMVEQARSVLTIEQQPQVERINYGGSEGEPQLHTSEDSHLRKIQVVDGVAIESTADIDADAGDFRPFDSLAEELRNGIAIAERAITPSVFDAITPEEMETQEETRYRVERSDLIAQLVALDSAYMTDKQILDEWAVLEKGYGRKAKELIELYKQRINSLSSWYPAR